MQLRVKGKSDFRQTLYRLRICRRLLARNAACVYASVYREVYEAELSTQGVHFNRLTLRYIYLCV